MSRGKLAAKDGRRRAGADRARDGLEAAVHGADFVIEAVPRTWPSSSGRSRAWDSLCGDQWCWPRHPALSVTEIAAATLRPQRSVACTSSTPCPDEAGGDRAALDTGDEAVAHHTEVARRRARRRWSSASRRASSPRASRHDRQRGLLHAPGRGQRRPDIDKALKLGLNHPWAPFEMVDLVGLDTRSGRPGVPAQEPGREITGPLPARAARQGGRLGRRRAADVYEYKERS